MGSPAMRSPAWKRLGLKLRNGDQSGDTAPDQDSTKTREHQQDVSSAGRTRNQELDHHQSAPTTNGQSTLGKRASRDSPAEEQKHPKKKGRKDGRQDELGGHALVSTPAVAKPVKGKDDISPATPRAQGGDPNYRRKKNQQGHAEGAIPKKHRTTGPGQDFSKEVKPEQTPLPALVTSEARQLVTSTETDFASPGNATPSKSSNFTTTGPKLKHLDSESPANRRKSVTFSSDTKKSDGNSASTLFQKWVADQKQPEEEQSKEPAQKEKKGKKEKKPKASQQAYLSYLTQYHTDRANWKFKKATQNDIIKDALNIFRIPKEYEEALLAYVSSIQGAGTLNRLKESCNSALKELESNKTMNPGHPESRKAMVEEALQERLERERKRRKTDDDMEELIEADDPNTYLRRMKRHRCVALMNALSRSTSTASSVRRAQQNVPNVSVVSRPATRKRKSRTDVSSDEDSSSDVSSSSDSDSSSDSSEVSDDSSNADSSDEDDESSEDSEKGKGGSDEELGSGSGSDSNSRSESSSDSNDDESDDSSESD